eukprot:140819_1
MAAYKIDLVHIKMTNQYSKDKDNRCPFTFNISNESMIIIYIMVIHFITECAYSLDCTFEILSIDHWSQGPDGRYFNFQRSLVDCYLNRIDWKGETFNVYSFHHDEIFNVKVWDYQYTSNTIGDAHGRRTSGGHITNWTIGDMLRLVDIDCLNTSNIIINPDRTILRQTSFEFYSIKFYIINEDISCGNYSITKVEITDNDSSNRSVWSTCTPGDTMQYQLYTCFYYVYTSTLSIKITNQHQEIVGGTTLSDEQIFNTEKLWFLDIGTNWCIPTASPTGQTLSPTIEPTFVPTIDPTTSPTYSPTKEEWFDKIDMNKTEGITMVIGSVFGFLLFLSIIICLVCVWSRKKQKLKRKEKTMYISNGLVLTICIEHYDIDLCDDNCNDINGILPDLNGLSKDADNIKTLFEDVLKYDVFYNNTDNNFVKTIWKKEEIKVFLEEKSNFLESNIESGRQYDGLIVIVSSHGLPPNFICTSDYAKYSHENIHRIFSWTHPKSRDIPRLFIFDCCAGNRKRRCKKFTLNTSKNPNEKKEQETTDINPVIWDINESNPDYRLAICNATNPGFESKMTVKNGSYFIKGFCEQLIYNLKNGNEKFIHEIFDDIQTDLHARGTQLPVSEWNNHTKYIRFKQKVSLEDNEMSEQHQSVELVHAQIAKCRNQKYSQIEMNVTDDENDQNR